MQPYGFLMFSGGKKECIGNKWVIVTIIIIIIIIIITIIILLPFSVKAFVLLFIIANTKFVSIPNVWAALIQTISLQSFFKDCLSQTLLGPFSNSLFHMFLLHALKS